MRADYLIAMGWVPEFFGKALLRLTLEFDEARSTVKRTPGPVTKSEQAAILGKLKTLQDTQDSLARVAVWQASKQKLEAPVDVITVIAARALVTFLNPL